MTQPIEESFSAPSSPISPYSNPASPRPPCPDRNSAHLPEATFPSFHSEQGKHSELHAIRSDETLKETHSPAQSPWPASPLSEGTEKEFATYTLTPSEPATSLVEKRNTLRRRLWVRRFIGMFVLVIVVAIALGAGLGFGLKSRNDKSKVSKNYLSIRGAFNGSGIALASQSFESGGFGSIVMYFQHHTGQIRSAQLDNDGDWKGGDATEVVATDAKNGTPIAAVAYARNETARWHIFYINVNNVVSEVINSNRTNVWTPGPLNKLNLKAIDDTSVGLQACWYGSFYSDVAYKHSPVPGQDNATTTDTDLAVGIHLWYANTATSFNSLAWVYGDTAWTEQQDFGPYNGHGGVGCYSWGPGSNTYVFFINLQNEVEILWKDLNISHRATEEHPIQAWTKAPVSIPTYANSSLGFTNYLYFQNPDLSFSGVNISWDAEHTSAPSAPSADSSTSSSSHADAFTINAPNSKGLPGTHLSVTAIPDSSGGDSLLAFYQTNGSDISVFTRDFDKGQWTSGGVPIPDA